MLTCASDERFVLFWDLPWKCPNRRIACYNQHSPGVKLVQCFPSTVYISFKDTSSKTGKEKLPAAITCAAGGGSALAHLEDLRSLTTPTQLLRVFIHKTRRLIWLLLLAGERNSVSGPVVF